MAIMSVYRAGKPRLRYDQAEMFSAVETTEDTKLIGLSLKTSKPVLVGLDGESAIVKPEADGDSTLSFESLYDDCYTVADLDRMHAAGVATPDEVPPTGHIVEVGFPIGVTAELALALIAQGQGDVRARLRSLVNDDVVFRQELIEQLLAVVRDYLERGADLTVYVRSCTAQHWEKITPSFKDGETWRFIPGD